MVLGFSQKVSVRPLYTNGAMAQMLMQPHATSQRRCLPRCASFKGISRSSPVNKLRGLEKNHVLARWSRSLDRDHKVYSWNHLFCTGVSSTPKLGNMWRPCCCADNSVTNDSGLVLHGLLFQATADKDTNCATMCRRSKRQKMHTYQCTRGNERR